MILVQEDDGCIHVYESLAEVTSAVEALDADGTLLSVFDDLGQRYAIEWVRANRKHWIGVSNGEYRLVPAGPPDPSALLDLLHSVPDVWPQTESHRVRAVVEKLSRQS